MFTFLSYPMNCNVALDAEKSCVLLQFPLACGCLPGMPRVFVVSLVCSVHLIPRINHISPSSILLDTGGRSAKNHRVAVLFSFNVTSARGPTFIYFFLMAFGSFAILSAAAGAQCSKLSVSDMVLCQNCMDFPSALRWLECERNPGSL